MEFKPYVEKFTPPNVITCPQCKGEITFRIHEIKAFEDYDYTNSPYLYKGIECPGCKRKIRV